MKTDMTMEEARRRFDYKDGVLFWKERPVSEFTRLADWKMWMTNNHRKAVGSVGSNGYHSFAITILGRKKRYSVHRVIWAWHYGQSEMEIDHKDNDPSNNRIENLREASSSQNKANRRLFAKSSSEYIGVSYEEGRKRWKAGIRKEQGNTITIGRFKCETAAALAYNREAIKEYGEFARLNFTGRQAKQRERMRA